MFQRLRGLLYITICAASTVFGQSQNPCATDDVHRQLLEANPVLADKEEVLNELLETGRAGRTTATVDTTYYDVPIVVHVVHDYGSEFLADDDIFDAVDNWAKAYLAQNSDTSAVIAPFKPYIGNARIRLHLATIDPSGNPTKGIVRHFSYLTTEGSDNAKYENWPNDKYINIWFINRFNSDHEGAAAYAYYPSTGAMIPWYDGVIGLASYVNTSKTIAHELGHVLNLKHVWGSTNSPAVACGNDNVDDTPPTKGHNPGCVASALYDTECAVGYAKTYVSSSGLPDSTVNYPDTVNSQNIMDYTYCSNMFSKGQCARMRTALTSSVAGRSNLITAANLAATGALSLRPDLPPVAEFIPRRAAGSGIYTDMRTYFLAFTQPASFSFRNMSWNDTVSSVLWEFSNGPATPTSSADIVDNRFSVPGWVTVSLTATSNAGSTTVVDNQAVYAADTTTVGGLGYVQQFGSAGSVSNWPMMNYYKNDFKWEYVNGTGMDDAGCIRYKSFNSTTRRTGDALGDFDDIYTPAFNLDGISGPLYVNFFTSGAYTTAGGSSPSDRDSIELQVSTTGGAVWTRLGGFNGAQLANKGNVSASYTPTSSSDWVGRAIEVDESHRSGQTYFRLRYRPGNAGNNLYVDNFSIGMFPAGVQQAVFVENSLLNVYPNPSHNGCTMQFKTGNDGHVRYAIADLSGKTLLTVDKEFSPNSVNTAYISRDVLPAAGMYFVTLTTGGINITQKMIVY